MNLITGHLTRLFDFSGRENRQPFWLWILIVYGVQTAASMIIMVPMMLSMSRSTAMLAQYDQAYLDQHPEVASRVMMGVMGSFFRNIMVFSGVMALLLFVLVAAAVVRRLHDTNRSGLWALPLAVTQLATLGSYLVIIPRFFTKVVALGPNPPPDAVNGVFAAIVPLFALTFLLGIVGFVLMIMLIIFLATRGTIGPNRYGDDLLPPPVYRPPPQWQPGPPMPPPPAHIAPGSWSDRPPGA